jgi:hypothetical protein
LLNFLHNFLSKKRGEKNEKAFILDLDYIYFLIAAQKTFSCAEASRSSPDIINKPAHDSFTRLLQRQPLSSENLWNEVKTFVKNDQGVLIIDDTVLEKPYSQKNGLITYLWSNKEKKVVKGVGLITLLWTDGQSYIPCDFRVYDKLGRQKISILKIC